jgi:hypothetical protein
MHVFEKLHAKAHTTVFNYLYIMNSFRKLFLIPSLKADRSLTGVIVESKSEMVYLQDVVPYTFLIWAIPK